MINFSTDWRGFAKAMFAAEDADPGYVLLKRATMPHGQKLRYVLAWCTYYNPGIAAVACQYTGDKFYRYLASVYGTAQRASERRHFRGQAGLIALRDWQMTYPHPEDMVEACYGMTYMRVRNNMKSMTQMGDYFYWKLADVWDTVFGDPVDFTGCEKYMPKVPKQGAEIIYGIEQPIVVGHSGKEEQWLVPVMAEITDYVRDLPYPLKGGRKLALQEAETVCCVYKQHVNGKYFLGWRSAKAYKRLMSVQDQAPDVVGRLLAGLYEGGIWTPKKLAPVLRSME